MNRSKTSGAICPCITGLHLETNPGNARALVQKHGEREVAEPAPIPLETDEMDGVFGLPGQRVPHPSYGALKSLHLI